MKYKLKTTIFGKIANLFCSEEKFENKFREKMVLPTTVNTKPVRCLDFDFDTVDLSKTINPILVAKDHVVLIHPDPEPDPEPENNEIVSANLYCDMV